MFSQRKIPNSFNDCIEQDSTSRNLITWADRVNELGTILVFLTAIGGLIIAIVNSISPDYYGYFDIETDFLWGTFFGTVLQYAIYVIIEIVIYNVCYYVLRALADIVYNTKISADLDILNNKTSSKVVYKADTYDSTNDNKEPDNIESQQVKQNITVQDNNYTVVKKNKGGNEVVHVHEYQAKS